jgi:hypothetical protein
MLRKKAGKEGVKLDEAASTGSTTQIKPNPLIQKAFGGPKIDLSKFPLNKESINK